MKEVWKDIPNYEDVYTISNFGNVFSIRRGRTLKPSPHSVTGYLRVSLCKNGNCIVHYIHSLVADSFVLGKKEGLEVNHIDGIKNNNRFSNLEWVTHHENVLHSHEKGLNKTNQVRGSKTGTAKLDECKVLEIKKSQGEISAFKLAKRFSVSLSTIYFIWNEKTWRHVKVGDSHD